MSHGPLVGGVQRLRGRHGHIGQDTGGSTKGIAGFVNYPISMVTPLSSGGFISLDTVGPLSGKTFTAT